MKESPQFEDRPQEKEDTRQIEELQNMYSTSIRQFAGPFCDKERTPFDYEAWEKAKILDNVSIIPAIDPRTF